MCRILILCILIFPFTIHRIFAQPQGLKSVKIHIFTPDKAPLPEANLVWWVDSDSVHATHQRSSGSGQVLLQTPVGRVLHLKVTHISYESLRAQFGLDSLHNQTLSIRLVPRSLQEIRVRSSKETFQVESDRIVIDVASSALLSGGSAFDILGNSPRVLVDPQTKAIIIDGKNGVQVYVNNRQIIMTNDQVAKYLQALPTSSIERIEVLTNPSSRYDANGGGVILIQLKKNSSEGISLDMTVAPGVGRFGKFTSSLNLTFRKKRYSLYLLYTPQWKKTYFTYNLQQKLLQGNILGETYGFQQRMISTQQHGLRVGGEITLGKNVLMGANLYGLLSEDITNTQSTTDFTFQHQPAGVVYAHSMFSTKLKNGLANLYLTRPIPSLRGRISVDADIASYQDNANSQTAYIRDQDSSVNELKSYFPVSILLKSTKVDIEAKPSSNFSIEGGLKASNSQISATPDLLSFTQEFQSLVDNLIKPFTYKESLWAGYTNASGRIKQLNWQVGLRYENARISVQTPELFRQTTFSNLFPTITIQNQFANKSSIKLTFNQRIIRPNFTSLNPAYVFLDPFTISTGNPLLIPQVSTTIQLSYQLPQKHSFLLQFSEAKNRITEVVYRKDTLSPVLYNTQINFDKERRLMASYTFPLKLTKFWRMQTTVAGSLIHFSTLTEGAPFVVNATGLTTNNSHSFTIGKFWSADLQFIARTATALGFMKYNPLFVVNLGVGRPLWNSKGSLKFSATDVFHTVTLINYGQYGYTDVRFRHRYETQVFTLSLSYRLGNEKLKHLDSHSTASESEQERIQKQ